MVKREIVFYSNRKRISIFDVSFEMVDMLMEITDNIALDCSHIEIINLNKYKIYKNAFIIKKHLQLLTQKPFVFLVQLN